MANNSIGQNIKRLRREHDMTQEELAELIGVSAQAISKWENENGLPDISQIVPLASVFGVTTDEIFGVRGSEENSSVSEMIREANGLYEYGNAESYLKAYEHLTEGLKKYPRNMILLCACLGHALALCLPDGGNMYIPEHAERISAEAKRQAKLIAAYSKNLPDTMWARYALVLLYSAEGTYEEAFSEAKNFPARADLTSCANLAWVHSRRGDFTRAEKCLCTNIDYILQALEDSAANLGKSYFSEGKYESAIAVYEAIIGVFDALFGDGSHPAYHDFDSGDCYLLLAEAYLKIGDSEKAMQNIDKSVDYYAALLKCMKDGRITNKSLANSPMIRETELDFALTEENIKKKLRQKLSQEWMEPLWENEEFCGKYKKE